MNQPAAGRRAAALRATLSPKMADRVAVELRLPVSLGSEALQERALALQLAGFRWDANTPPRVKSAGRDEIGTDNPTDRTHLIWGWADHASRLRLEDEPDVVAVWQAEDTGSTT